MAQLFEHGNTAVFDLTCHVGQRGDVIIPIDNDDDGNCEFFISMSPLEAKDLIGLLQQELQKYRKALDGDEEDLEAAA